MTFNELIERLRNIDSGYAVLLGVWIEDFNKSSINSYDKIYGFIRGLECSNVISEEEANSLICKLLQPSIQD